jgi:hypothetical protein
MFSLWNCNEWKEGKSHSWCFFVSTKYLQLSLTTLSQRNDHNCLRSLAAGLPGSKNIKMKWHPLCFAYLLRFQKLVDKFLTKENSYSNHFSSSLLLSLSPPPLSLSHTHTHTHSNRDTKRVCVRQRMRVSEFKDVKVTSKMLL